MTSKSVISWLKLIIVLAVFYLLSQVTEVYLPVIIAIVITFILNPLVNALCNISVKPLRNGMPRGVAVLLAFGIMVLILAVVIIFVFLPFITEFNKFIIDLPALLKKFHILFSTIEQKANEIDFPDNIRAVFDQAMSSAASFSVELARRIIHALLGFASQIISLVVVPFLTYYFLKDGKELRDHIVAVFPAGVRNEVCRATEDMGLVVSGYIRGQVVISIIIGLLVFSGMYLLGVSYPLVLGLMATLTETIPIIGPIIGSVPGILLAFLISPALAVKVVVFYIIIHQIENHIVVPNIMGHTIDLHPVFIILSLLIGGQLFGVVGMILAVPVAALLRVISRHIWYFHER